MNAEQLRAIQMPFKERYRSEPERAKATLVSVGHVDFQRLAVDLVARPAGQRDFGMHPLTGGDGTFACAAQSLLEALVGCAGVTMAAVVTAMSLPVTFAEVVAEGDLDFRGTLGVSREVPVGFQAVRLLFRFDSAASDEQLAKATQLAERYCVVAQTLRQVESRWERSPAALLEKS